MHFSNDPNDNICYVDSIPGYLGWPFLQLNQVSCYIKNAFPLCCNVIFEWNDGCISLFGKIEQFAIIKISLRKSCYKLGTH